MFFLRLSLLFYEIHHLQISDTKLTESRVELAKTYSTGQKQACIPSPCSAPFSNESNSLMHY